MKVKRWNGATVSVSYCNVSKTASRTIISVASFAIIPCGNSKKSEENSKNLKWRVFMCLGNQGQHLHDTLCSAIWRPLSYSASRGWKRWTTKTWRYKTIFNDALDKKHSWTWSTLTLTTEKIKCCVLSAYATYWARDWEMMQNSPRSIFVVKLKTECPWES